MTSVAVEEGRKEKQEKDGGEGHKGVDDESILPSRGLWFLLR